MDSESATIPGTIDQHGGRSITLGLARHFRLSHPSTYLPINTDGSKRVALTTLCEVVNVSSVGTHQTSIYTHIVCEPVADISIKGYFPYREETPISS